MTLRLRPRRGRRRWLPAIALAAGLTLIPTTGAGAATVSSGHLDWSSANVYDNGAPANTNRTWLGYVTGLAAGTATPSDAAGGDTITPASPRGATELGTFSFPATGGTYDAASGSGTVELRGTITFASTLHGFTISVANPQLVLSGTTGKIFASGQGSTSGGPTTYDRTSPLFALDLTTASTTDWPDGSRTIAGIVPSLATADYAFPPNYLAGAGPDRTPNTFGSFAVTLATSPATSPDPGPGSSQPAGGSSSPGAVKPGRLTGKVSGATKARKRVVATLSRTLGANPKRTYQIRLTAHGRTIATGTLRGRTLTLDVRKGKTTYPRLKGNFTVRATSKLAKWKPTPILLG